MALRTPPSWLQQGSHPAENDRLTTQAIFTTTGIIGASSMAVTAQGSPNMTVNVAAGWAAIVGTTQSNMGTYVAYNDATTVLTITTAPTSNSRIDRIVATVNDAYYSGATNNVTFTVVAGTVAASPVAPAVPANSISLATIVVGTNVTVINSGNITDTRVLTTTSIIDTSSFVTTTGVATLTNKTLTSPTINTPTVTNGTFATPTLASPVFTGAAAETVSITGGFGSGLTIYIQSTPVQFLAGAFATNNGPVNLTWSAGTTLNTYLATNQSVTMTMIISNSTTGYCVNAVQVDGTTSGVTTYWQGGTAPTTGNANSRDAYTFVVMKNGSGVFTVFASLTKFA